MNEGPDSAVSEASTLAGNPIAPPFVPLANEEHSAANSVINDIAAVIVENTQTDVANNGFEDVVNGAVGGVGVGAVDNVHEVPVSNTTLTTDAVPLLKSLFGVL